MASALNNIDFPAGKSADECKLLYENFVCMFGETIEPSIILMILDNSQWNVELAADDLMKLQADIMTDKPKPKSKMKDSGNSLSEYAVGDQRNSPHLGSTSSFKSDSVLDSSFKNDKLNIDLSQAIIEDEIDCNNIAGNFESDDDADVIIEEEKEVVLNDNVDGGLDYYNTLYQSLGLNDSFGLPSVSSEMHFINPVEIVDNVKLPSNRTPRTKSMKLVNTGKKDSIPKVGTNEKKVPGTKLGIKEKKESFMKLCPDNKRPNTKVVTASPTNYKQIKAIKNDLERIYRLSVSGVKLLILLRGVTGSGKSQTADMLLKRLNSSGVFDYKLMSNGHIFSTDDFFDTKSGYKFDNSKLSEAHLWNQKRVSNAIKKSKSPIIVDNTNTQLWEMQPYVIIAVASGYDVEVLEPTTKWKFNENELFKRNQHNVPKQKIRNMLDRYEEKNLTGNKLLSILGLKYTKHVKPPMYNKHFNMRSEVQEKEKPLKNDVKRNRKKSDSSNSNDVIQELFSAFTIGKGQSLKNIESVWIPEHDNSKIKVLEPFFSTATADGKKENLSFTKDKEWDLFSNPGNSKDDDESDKLFSLALKNAKKYNVSPVKSPACNPLKESTNSKGSATEALTPIFGRGGFSLWNTSNFGKDEQVYESVDCTVSNNVFSEDGITLKKQFALDKSFDSAVCPNVPELRNIIQVENDTDSTTSTVNSSDSNITVVNQALNKQEIPNEFFYKNFEIAKKIHNCFERVLMFLLCRVRILILLRGCPGSGKTFIARSIIDVFNESQTPVNKLKYCDHIFSADDYFTTEESGYVFDRHGLSEAHLATQNKAKNTMENSISPVIIDNCNIEMLEMKPYVESAVKYGYVIEILEPDTLWKFNVDQLTKCNIHSVSRIKIKYMLDRFEKDVTCSKMLDMFELKYSDDQKPPLPAVDLSNNNSLVKECTIIDQICMTNKEDKLETVGNDISIVESFTNNIDEISIKTTKTAEVEVEETVTKDIFTKSLSKRKRKKKIIPLLETLLNDFKNDFDRILMLVLCKVKVLVLMRGCSGSGKTFMAKRLIDKLNQLCSNDPVMLYSDHIFSDENSMITMKPSQDYLKECSVADAFHKSLYVVKTLIQKHINPIIIDNCNIKVDEMIKFIELGIGEGYIIEILEPDTKWRYDANELFKRSASSVSKDEIRKCLSMFDRSINRRTLTDLLDLRYSNENAPKIEDQQVFLEAVRLVYPILEKDDNFTEAVQHLESLPVCKFDSSDAFKSSQVVPDILNENKIAFCEILPDESSLNRSSKPPQEIDDGDNIANDKCVNMVEVSTDKSLGSSDNNTKPQDEIDISGFSTTNDSQQDVATGTSSCEVFANKSISDDNGLLQNESNINEDANSNGSQQDLNAVDLPTCELFPNESSSDIDGSPQNESDICENMKDVTVTGLLSNNSTSNSNGKPPDAISVGENSTSNDTQQISENICKDFILIRNQGESSFSKECDGNSISEENRTSFDKPEISSSSSNENYVGCISDIYVSQHSLEEVNVIDFLSKNMKKINETADINDTHTYEEHWKPWERSSSSESNDITNENINSKPPRTNIEYSRKKNTSDNIFVTSQDENKNKIKKEFLNWSAVGDTSVGWFDKVKDTISGTSSEPVYPKPQRLRDSDISEDVKNNLIHSLYKSEENRPVNQLPLSSENLDESLDVKSDIINLLKNDEDDDASSSSQSENCQNDCDRDLIKSNAAVLSSLFPKIAPAYFEELLEKCRGDINWVAELLLEECSQEGIDFTEVPQLLNEIDNTYQNSESVVPNNSFNSDNINLNESSSIDHHRKKFRKGLISRTKSKLSDRAAELKSIIEKNIVLNASNYSDNIMKIINKKKTIQKNNTFSDQEYFETCSENFEIIDNNSTSDHDESLAGCSKQIDEEEEEENATGYTHNIEVDEVAVTESFLSDDDNNAVDDDSKLKFVFNKDLVSSLNESFGNSGLPVNFFSNEYVVDLPRSLAKQLHTCIINSIQNQIEEEEDRMEQMIREDEELARCLQEAEQNEGGARGNQTPNLQEIIDMETALALYQADIDNAQKENSETFAARLGKKILLEKFPNINQKALFDMYKINNYSVHDTISALMLNQNSETDLGDWEMQLLERAKQESEKFASKERAANSEKPSDEVGRNEATSDFEYYREEGQRHQRERNICFSKATAAYNKGNKSVASYYSQLANLHLKQIEQANSMAATVLLSVHKASSEVTLDLHYYKAREAVEVLNIFLDSAIIRLRESQMTKRTLFIITGRGVHSHKKQSVLRPLIQKKLESRKIRITTVNPGMFIVVIKRSTPLSNGQ